MRHIKDARHIVIIASWKYTDEGNYPIGFQVNRDHASVIHARKQYYRDNKLHEMADDYMSKFAGIRPKREIYENFELTNR